MLSMLLVVLAVVAAVYYHIIRRFDYWRIRNVPNRKPTSILGNYSDVFLLKVHPAYVINKLYKDFLQEPYFGVFYGSDPTLIVKDPDLLKLITTRDFYYFHGRELSNYNSKEKSTRNLFSEGGDYWRVVRQNLTPVFTSAKMKNMFPLIEKCSHEFEDMFDSEVKMSTELNIRNVAGRFLLACVGSCAFGIDSETMGKDYKKNPFIKFLEFFFRGSKIVAFIGFFRSMFPFIFYKLRLDVIPSGAHDYFTKIITSVFQARDNKPTSRNDLIDYILHFKESSYLIGDSISNLKTGDNLKVQLAVNDDLLVSQSMIFFLAGFETSATTITYTVYELSKHPEAQKKVQAEVDAYLHRHGNKLTYDIVTELPYTWACVEEALRLYPVLVYIAREVMDDYTLPTDVTLEKGTRIHIPVYELHRDPKFFPEPEVYRPERFVGDERRNIIPYTYMPFGAGPRNCIGMRFAKMQVMAGIVTILKKYTLELTEKTQKTPFVLSPLFFIPTPKTNITIKATPRPGWETRLYNKG